MHNWMGMLNVRSSLDWSRFNALPNADELTQIASTKCRCNFNPLSLPICEIHPCQCGCLKRKDGATCKWRTLHFEMITAMEGLNLESQEGRLTYCQVIEAQGKLGPGSARERNLLNILALQSMPLANSYAVLDRTQSINRTGLRADGLLPTFCKTSRFFSLSLGADLKPSDIATFFAHTPTSDFTGMFFSFHGC
jgi:hypothetical protein